jgi:catechol 2,3-dioxygenase-like lactoylglutathione lyase family enzyme
MAVCALDHIVLNVADVERPLHFYETTLGLAAERVEAWRRHEVGTIDDIWRHTGADPNDADTCYRRDIIRPVGMVEMYRSTRRSTIGATLSSHI